MSAQPKIYLIKATYKSSTKKTENLCDSCKFKDSGCEMKGRHVDAVTECFMFGKDKKKGGKG